MLQVCMCDEHQVDVAQPWFQRTEKLRIQGFCPTTVQQYCDGAQAKNAALPIKGIPRYRNAFNVHDFCTTCTQVIDRSSSCDAIFYANYSST
mmetsp:Transcript_23668/g.55210  ORF Transcript_23668/g.55210 Transcript_23668/m.55210 type:complete len:92 (+) Transcript_23668:2641-2916(+)